MNGTSPLLTTITLSLCVSVCTAGDSPQKVLSKLTPIIELVKKKDKTAAEALVTELKQADKLTPTQLHYAQIAISSIDQKPKYPDPSLIELSIGSVSLSDCEWTNAKTEHLSPLRNIWSSRAAEFRFLETSEGMHRSGLYAHASSEYTFNLGGRWEKFEGAGALGYKKGELPYPYSSVDFIIKVDGEVVFSRRRADGSAKHAEFSISVRNAKTLTLITTGAGNGISGDHALWISPTLKRPRR